MAVLSASPSNCGSMLDHMLESEKQETDRWLRAEMNSLVNPMLEQLFHKLKDKFIAMLALYGLTEHSQLNVEKTLHRTSSSNGGTQVHLPDLNLESQTPSISTQMDNTPILSMSLLNQSEDYSLQQQRFHQLQSTNSPNQPTTQLTSNIETQSKIIKEEIIIDIDDDDEKEEVITVQSIEPFGYVQPVSSKNEHNWPDHNDDIEEDCECDDCLNGGIDGIKEEEEEEDWNLEENVHSNDTNEDGPSRQTKQPRTTEEVQPLPPRRSAGYTEQMIITLSLQCLHSDCMEMFPNKKLLTEHMEQVHCIRKYRCMVKDCNQSFPIQSSITEHFRVAHLTITEWPCHYCPKQYSTYSMLCMHNYAYHHLGQYQCAFPGCGVIEECKKKLYNHQFQEHKQTQACSHPGCAYTSSSMTKLRNHERTHLGRKPFLCRWPEGCTFASAHRTSTVAHIRKHLAKAERDNPNMMATISTNPKDHLQVLEELL